MSENKNKTITLEELKEILKEVNTIKDLEEKGNIIINKDDKKLLQYINVISDGKEEKYYLVDKKKYINDKIEKEDFDLKNHIFFVEVELNSKTKTFDKKVVFSKSLFLKSLKLNDSTFNKEVIFSNSIFYKKIDFSDTTFNKKISFYCSNFTGNDSFKKTTFNGETIFSKAIFNGDVYFNLGSKFNGEVSENNNITIKFQNTTFNGKTYFSGSTIKNVNFEKSVFTGKAKFQNTNFDGYIIFEKTKFENNVCFEDIEIKDKTSLSFEKSTYKESFFLYPNKCSKEQKFTLNLKGLAGSSDSLFFNENIIKCLDENTPRETYNIFKNALLARKDTINALEYYKMENERYLKDMKKNKIPYTWTDKIILLFTKYVSYFSTDPLRAILWWIGVWVIFGGIIFYTYQINLDLTNTNINNIHRELVRYAFNPLASISDGKEIFDKTNGWTEFAIRLLTFIKTILLGVITYEIIKSVRKFSRRF